MVDPNPYQSPAEDPQASEPAIVMDCPQCGSRMEPGYISTRLRIHWADWGHRWWHFSYGQRIPGTSPPFIGANRLTGFRCGNCELIIFRYGLHKNAYAPGGR